MNVLLRMALSSSSAFQSAVRDYRTLLSLYVRPALGEVRLDRLRPLDLQSLVLGLTKRGLSARTVRYTHAVLRSALDRARRWKLLVENPSAGMPLPRADKREFQVLKPEEAQRFAAFCREDPAGLVFLVALTTGPPCRILHRHNARGVHPGATRRVESPAS